MEGGWKAKATLTSCVWRWKCSAMSVASSEPMEVASSSGISFHPGLPLVRRAAARL